MPQEQMIARRLTLLHKKIKGKIDRLPIDAAAKAIGVSSDYLKRFLLNQTSMGGQSTIPFDYSYGMLYTESKEQRLRRMIREQIRRALQ
jgi:hypothetical protein